MKRKVRIAIAVAAAVCAALFLFFYFTGMLPTWEQVLNYFGICTHSHMDEEAVLEVTFLSVGQGDCTLIETAQYAALIDAGLGESYDAIAAALDARGIRELDAVFVTHPHTDHMGALRALMGRYGVKQLYFADIPAEHTPTSAAYERLLDEIALRNVPLQILSRGDQLSVPVQAKEEGASLLGILSVLSSGEGSDLNNCSMVLRLQLGKTAALFMGDAEAEIERLLIGRRAELRADVLKVGHHGTRYATTEEFLAAVQPRYAVVSCGLGNEYGYPKEETVQRIEAAGAALLRTDTMGDITLCFDGSCVWIKGENIAEDAA